MLRIERVIKGAATASKRPQSRARAGMSIDAPDPAHEPSRDWRLALVAFVVGVAVGLGGRLFS